MSGSLDKCPICGVGTNKLLKCPGCKEIIEVFDSRGVSFTVDSEIMFPRMVGGFLEKGTIFRIVDEANVITRYFEPMYRIPLYDEPHKLSEILKPSDIWMISNSRKRTSRSCTGEDKKEIITSPVAVPAKSKADKKAPLVESAKTVVKSTDTAEKSKAKGSDKASENFSPIVISKAKGKVAKARPMEADDVNLEEEEERVSKRCKLSEDSVGIGKALFYSKMYHEAASKENSKSEEVVSSSVSAKAKRAAGAAMNEIESSVNMKDSVPTVEEVSATQKPKRTASAMPAKPAVVASPIKVPQMPQTVSSKSFTSTVPANFKQTGPVVPPLTVTNVSETKCNRPTAKVLSFEQVEDLCMTHYSTKAPSNKASPTSALNPSENRIAKKAKAPAPVAASVTPSTSIRGGFSVSSVLGGITNEYQRASAFEDDDELAEAYDPYKSVRGGGSAVQSQPEPSGRPSTVAVPMVAAVTHRETSGGRPAPAARFSLSSLASEDAEVFDPYKSVRGGGGSYASRPTPSSAAYAQNVPVPQRAPTVITPRVSISDLNSTSESYDPFKGIRDTSSSFVNTRVSVSALTNGEECYDPYKNLRAKLVPMRPLPNISASAGNVPNQGVEEGEVCEANATEQEKPNFSSKGKNIGGKGALQVINSNSKSNVGATTRSENSNRHYVETEVMKMERENRTKEIDNAIHNGDVNQVNEILGISNSRGARRGIVNLPAWMTMQNGDVSGAATEVRPVAEPANESSGKNSIQQKALGQYKALISDLLANKTSNM